MKKVIALITAAALLTVSLVGCGGKEEKASADAADGNQSLKIAYLTENLGDNGFNDEAYTGIERYMEDNNIKIDVVETKGLQDYEINARNFAQDHYDLILVTSASAEELIIPLAEEYPDSRFVIADGTVDDVENITCWESRVAESGFLLGVFNVLMNQHLGGDAKAAIILGMRSATLERTQYSFSAGAEWVDGEATTVYVGSFSDPAKGKEIALQLYQADMKLIQAYAGGSGLGVYQAAETMPEGYWALGAAYGQFDLSDRILASMTKNAGNIWYDVITSFSEGTLQNGIVSYGIKEGGVGIKYGPNSEGIIPQEIKDQVKELEDKIVAGEITPPQTEAEYLAFGK